MRTRNLLLTLAFLISSVVPVGAGTITFEQIYQEVTGIVSWYGGKHHGRKMSNGKKFDKNKLTCAASSRYKLGEVLEVTNIKNGKSVVVTVTDRGNFKKYGRELDLSEQAFKEIACLDKGLQKVTIKRL